jgi:hypothetical protein
VAAVRPQSLLVVLYGVLAMDEVVLGALVSASWPVVLAVLLLAGAVTIVVVERANRHGRPDGRPQRPVAAAASRSGGASLRHLRCTPATWPCGPLTADSRPAAHGYRHLPCRRSARD